MRRAFSSVFVLLLGTSLHAGPVTPERALRVAERVFSSASATKAVDASSLKIVWDGEFEPATKAAVDPTLYVITRPEGGFVMVAGNDNVQPVLGFSFENDFQVEGMPENVRWWMQQYKDYVRSATTTTLEVVDQWARYEETKVTADPIEDDTEGLTDEFLSSRTNLWNQTNPANYFCPDLEGVEQTSYCGCSALAIAEVMAWFGEQNLPCFSGTVPSYTYKIGDREIMVPSHGLGTVYDWAGMKALASSDSSEFYSQVNGFNWDNAWAYVFYGAGRNNPVTHSINTLTEVGYSVAHLVYDIATILQAKFLDGGTVVSPWNLEARLFFSFIGYNQNAQKVFKNDYPYAEWEIMLTDQISRYPVLYVGELADHSTGHSYVADGYANYSGNRMFHFNMGWGGDWNGYYTLDFQYIFESQHYFTMNFYPDPTSVARSYLEYQTSGGLYYRGGYNTGALDFDAIMLYNLCSTTFEGVVVPAIESAAGELLQIDENNGEEVSFVPITGKNSSSYTDIRREEPAQAAFGDKVRLYYKGKGREDALPVVAIPRLKGLGAIPFYPAAAIKKAESYHVGDYFELAITNSSYVHHHSKWKVTAPDGDVSEFVFDDYHFQLTSEGEYKIEATIYDAKDPSVELETLVTYLTVN